MQPLFRLTMICAILSSVTLTVARAQPYENAIGLRLGYPNAISLKHYLDGDAAIEAYIGARPYRNYGYTTLSVAYQQHFDFGLEDELAALRWYVGAGGSLPFWNYRDGFYVGRGPDRYASTSLGINGYLGLEYTFDAVPINLTLDWVPTIFIGNTFRRGIGIGNTNLAVRYVLGR